MICVMELALGRGERRENAGEVATSEPRRPAAAGQRTGAYVPDPCLVKPGDKGGASAGVNIAPGSDDDGWVVPPPVRLSDGTQIQLYKDGEALHAAYEAIRTARRRILLEVYIFSPDDTGTAFTELLAAKAREGVQVAVIYDALGSMGGGSKPLEQIRQAGGRVEAFHPVWPWELKFGWRPWNRDHRKLLIIDDEVAGLGGLNVGANYAGSWVKRARARARQSGGSGLFGGSTGGTFIKGVGHLLGSGLGGGRVGGDGEVNTDLNANGVPDACEPWRDNAIGVYGPGARMFRDAFFRSWHYVTRGGRIARAQHVYNTDGSAGDLGVFASVPTMRSPLQPFLHRLIGGARRSVELTMAYFAPGDELIDKLCRAARRGVRVRLMVPGRSDVKILKIAAQSFYEKLMTAGVEVYERQGVVLHTKSLCVDGAVSFIGSTNLDYRSIEYNCELSAVVRSTQFGAQLHDLFENDVYFAKRIDLNEWRRRPQWDRFVQWGVSRARYLL